MENFKNSGWPLLIIIVVMVGLAGGVAVSCSSGEEKESEKSGQAEATTSTRASQLDQNKLDQASFTELSSDFVDRVIHDQSVDKHLEIFKNANADSLDEALNTDRKRLTFWMNIYNGYTQYFLKKDPSLYKEDRNAYFDKDQIDIAGYSVSFNDIEHGVIRKGSTIWSKGYIRVRAFRKDFVQKYALDTVDYRIHFALNCGAKSCPPVVTYREDVVAEQLNANSRFYLNNVVEYNKEQSVVKVPALMKWFSADFGGDDADKRAILREHGALPEGVDPEVEYLPYDWTMKIENYKSYDI